MNGTWRSHRRITRVPCLKALMGLHRTWNNIRNPPGEPKRPPLSVCPLSFSTVPFSVPSRFTTCSRRSLLSVPQARTLVLFRDLCIGRSLARDALVQIFLGLCHISGVTSEVASPESSSQRNLEDTSPSPRLLPPSDRTMLRSFSPVCTSSLYRRSTYLTIFISYFPP